MKKIFSLVALVGMFALMSFSEVSATSNTAMGANYDCDAIATNFANNHPNSDWCTAYDIMYDNCERILNKKKEK